MKFRSGNVKVSEGKTGPLTAQAADTKGDYQTKRKRKSKMSGERKGNSSSTTRFAGQPDQPPKRKKRKSRLTGDNKRISSGFDR